MIYIKTDINNKVVYINYQPLDKNNGIGVETEEQLKNLEGAVVDNIPAPEHKKDYYGILYYTKEDGLFYKYEEIKQPESKKYNITEELYQQIINDYKNQNS